MKTITLEYVDVFDENKNKEIIFSKSILNSKYAAKSLFALMIDGESMQPLILDKSVLITDLSQKELIHNSIYLIHFDNKMWVKKFNKEKKDSTFVSINKEYSHLIYKKEDVHVIAKVLLTFTNL